MQDARQRPAHGSPISTGQPGHPCDTAVLADQQRLLAEIETICNTTQEALFMVRVDGLEFRYVKHNAAHKRQTGLSGIEGKTPADLVGPELGRTIAANYARCIASGGTISYEEQLDLPAGRRTWNTTLTPVFEAGLPAYLVGSSRDITEERRIAEEFRQLLLRNECLVRILQYDSESIHGYLDFVVKQALELTQSTYGQLFLHDDVTHAFTLQSCSCAISQPCPGRDRSGVHVLGDDDIWYEAIRQERPVLMNDGQRTALMPAGFHAARTRIGRHLAIPVMDGGRILAIIGVANRKDPYSEADVLNLSVVMRAVCQEVGRKKSKALLAKIPQQVPGAVYQYLMRPNGQVSVPFISEGIRELFGLDPEDVVHDAAPLFNLIHPEDRDRIRESVQRSFTSLAIWDQSYRIRQPDGGFSWIRGLARPERQPDGSVVWYGYLREINEIMKVHESLKQSEERQRRLTEELEHFFSVNLDLLCIADLDGRFVKLNRSWELLLGYPVEELQGKAFIDFVHPADIPRTLGVMNSLAMEGQVLNFVNRYRCLDGSYKYIEWRSRPFGRLIYAAARDITEHIGLERQLHNQKEQFELAIRGSKDGIWDWDIRSNQLYMSPRGKEQLGYRDHELPSRITALARCIHPDELRAFTGQMEKYLDGQVADFSVECRLRHKNGSYRWVWVRGEALRDSRGKAYRMAGSQTDITELRQAERALLHSHDLMRYVIEHNNCAVAVYDRNMIYMYVSQRFIENYRLGDREIIGRSHYAVFPELPQAWRDVHQRCLRGEVIRSEGDERFDRLDGSVDWVVWECRPWHEADGSIGGMILYNEVINERKQLELAIRAEREQFRTTLLSVGDGIISTDMEGRITVMNPVAEALTGWTQKGAAGRPIEDVFHIISEHTRRVIESPVRSVLRTGCIVELDNHTLLLSRTGREVPIEDSAAPIRDEHGGISGVVIVFRDCLEKKEKQSQIEHLSFYDHLTGLYNRRFMEEALQRLDTAVNLPLTAIVIDVNGLKLTNDAFGHEMGDRLLRTVSDILRLCCRAEDIVCRIGGDEFAILLPRTGAGQAEAIRQRIVTAASEARLESVIVSLAVGYAVKETDTEPIVDTLREADNRMYRNKVKYGRTMRSQTIETVLRNINSKYEQEQIHTERVSQYCEGIARALGLSVREVEDIKIAGILHDIGKIMVPPDLLQKPGMLTAAERAVVRRHPEIGYQILKSVDEYAALSEAVLHHHERWDGTGYPAGLARREIPLQARIITIADAYESMTARRSYQRTLSAQEAQAELQRCAGSQFDPEIVRVFISQVL